VHTSRTGTPRISHNSATIGERVLSTSSPSSSYAHPAAAAAVPVMTSWHRTSCKHRSIALLATQLPQRDFSTNDDQVEIPLRYVSAAHTAETQLPYIAIFSDLLEHTELKIV